MNALRRTKFGRITGMAAMGTVIAASAHADTGAIELTDSSHLQYQINQDITFSSTSSASGAASEASYTQSVAASTMSGGTTMDELDDAFDGSGALSVSLVAATTTPDTGDEDWEFYSKNGAAIPNGACLGSGATAATPTTLTGATFTASGFTGGEMITVRFNRVDTVVTFMAADQTPEQVVARINTALGSQLASVVGGAIVFSTPRFEAQIEVTGASTTAIGLSAATYNGGTLGDAREMIFPDRMIGDVRVSRRVFVPEDDTFLRRLDRFENTGTAPVTFTVGITNNLGSDNNTIVYATSSGDALAGLDDEWVGSFQNWSGTTSSDPRLAFIFGNADSPTRPVAVNYVDGDDNPSWIYSLTLAAGEVKTIANFVVGAPTKAAAQSVAEALVDPRGRAAALRCIPAADLATIVNFPMAPCALEADTTCDDGNVATEGDTCTGYLTCTGTPIPTDAGVPSDVDAGGGGGGGGGGSDGCSCTVAGGSGSNTPGLLAALLTAFVVAFRSRVRSARAARVVARAR